MTTGYSWLMFFHLLGLTVFLMPHGVNAAASFLVRGPVTAQTRPLLVISQRASIGSNVGLLLLIVTGVWMGFAGGWWGRGWIWTSITVLVVVGGAMGFLARPYYKAREAAGKDDTAVAVPLSLARPQALAAIGALGLLVLIFLMVFKPF